MDAILGKIHLAIQERIQTAMPDIAWIDQDLGQLEFYKDTVPVKFPCVLLDIVNIAYTDNSRKSQLATATLEVRLAVLNYDPSNQLSDQLRKERALKFYNTEHRLNQVLHGWCDNENFTKLSRTQSQTEKREDQLRVRPLRYDFSFMDDTAMDVAASVVPRPDIMSV